MRAADVAPAPSLPSFPLLGRVAGCLWFIAVTLVYAQPLIASLGALPPGSLAFADWAPVVSRACAVVFCLTMSWLMLTRRQAVARHEGLFAQATALAATYGVWLVGMLPAARVSPTVDLLSAAITLLGSLMIVLALGHLGRSFSIAPQARKLVVTGPYRFVRHPLYLAEEIAVLGVLLHVAPYAALPFLAIHLGLQIRRMTYEEALLASVFPDYRDYARRTARLIPGVW